MLFDTICFKGKHSASIRIWHWGTFFIMLGSLATVLFAKTLFSTKTNIALVQQSLHEKNVMVSNDQARAVSHDFNDLLWHWHTYIGYASGIFLLFRVVLEFFQPKREKIIPILKTAIVALKIPQQEKKEAQHFLVVRLIYLLFYFALLVQTLTGLFLVYSDGVDSLKNARHNMKDLHSAFMWVIISYLVLHIGGVILAELGRKNRGIVSQMINGGE